MPIAVTTSDRARRTVIGSPPFLAPEQWGGDELVPATDQYSLASLFYLVLTGAHAYEGQEHPDVRKRNYLRAPVPAHEVAAQNLRPAVPPAISPVLERAMALKPADRYASMEELSAAFRAAMTRKGHPLSRRPRVFLSYQRGGSLALALLIKSELEAQHNCEVFVDVTQKELPGEIPGHLARSIERSDVFVCLLNRNTLNSPWVKSEVKLAHQAGKPMIPVRQEGFRIPRNLEDQPDYLQSLLRSFGPPIYDRQGEFIGAAIARLSELIRQSLE